MLWYIYNGHSSHNEKVVLCGYLLIKPTALTRLVGCISTTCQPCPMMHVSAPLSMMDVLKFAGKVSEFRHARRCSPGMNTSTVLTAVLQNDVRVVMAWPTSRLSTSLQLARNALRMVSLLESTLLSSWSCSYISAWFPLAY